MRNISRRRLTIGLAGAAAVAALVLAAAAPASFPGANGKIFYEQGVEGTPETDIFSIDPNGAGALDLTAANGFSEERPAVSADGERVAFQSYRDEGWNVFSMNADGSGQLDLTNTKEPVINFEPAWSPDGSKVVFMRQGLTPGEQDIWVVDANGTNAVDLTKSPEVNESSPEFSPDGTKIVYISTGPDACCTAHYNNDIWIMDADGSNQAPLTTTDYPTQNIAPSWSPDGLEIAYSVNSTPSAVDDGIHLMNANGTNQHRLLPEGSPVSTNVLAWSPDGTEIAYEGGNAEGLYTMSVDGFERQPLVEGVFEPYPSWAPALGASGGGEEGGGGEGGGGAGGGSSSPPPVAPPPIAPPQPPNKFGFGKVKLNKAMGSAKLTLVLPGPGGVALSGKGVKKVVRSAKAAGDIGIPVVALGKAKVTLKETGTVKLALKVTFTPVGGSPNTQGHPLKLKLRG